ncbi:MAG: CgeB family protein [Planctomycetales bacterium]|jgi:hypothetical protein
MNILILNDNFDEYSLGWSYKRGFESLGHSVRMIDPVERLRTSRLWENRISRRLLERSLIETFNRRWLPELLRESADLIWVGKGAWAVPWLWRQYKEHRPETTLLCYNGDNPLVTYSRGGNRPWVTESIECFDVFCTYNSCLVEPLLEAGARQVGCIPFAWDPDIHPMHPYGDFERDLFFVGNGDPYRGRWLSQILSSPEARHWKVDVYGSWASRMCRSFSNAVHHKNVVGHDMARLIASSRVTLNILRVQNEGSHNMRTFETPGAGGLLASQYSDEQAGFLNSRDGAILFRDPDDAVRQIASALADPDRCESMANMGHSCVRHHTYRHRAESMLKLLVRGN